jgi:hypothetical protein
MASNQLENAKNSLASSGASIKNFGMSVNADGTTSFFATLEKSSAEQTKRLEKKQVENVTMANDFIDAFNSFAAYLNIQTAITINPLIL